MLDSKFILIADEPILDFVNTLVEHSDHSTEYLKMPQDAEAFFKAVFNENFKVSKKSLVQIKNYRKVLHLFFTKIIKKKGIRSQHLELPWPERARPNYIVKLSTSESYDKLKIDLRVESNNWPLVIVSQKLIEFLNQAKLSRIKKCQSQSCSHIFYDTTKANSRIWCSMKSCGNLAKIRKFRNKV